MSVTNQVKSVEKYSDILQRWVEIAVLDESYIHRNITSQIDLTDLELDEYYFKLLKLWPGLDTATRLELSLSPAGVKEISELIIGENPALHPRNVARVEGISDDLSEDLRLIRDWFSSGGKEGTKPMVVSTDA